MNYYSDYKRNPYHEKMMNNTLLLYVLLHNWPIRTIFFDGSPEKWEVWSLGRFLSPAADHETLQFLYTLRLIYMRPQWATAPRPDPFHNLWKQTGRESFTMPICSVLLYVTKWL